MTVCPKCNGYGIVGSAVPDILRGRGHIFSSNECDRCNGSGEVQMTNEEWLKQANTEQLAEVFYIVFHNNADRVLNAFWDKHKEVFKKNVVEWLKQPHTKE